MVVVVDVVAVTVGLVAEGSVVGGTAAGGSVASLGADSFGASVDVAASSSGVVHADVEPTTSRAPITSRRT